MRYKPGMVNNTMPFKLHGRSSTIVYSACCFLNVLSATTVAVYLYFPPFLPFCMADALLYRLPIFLTLFIVFRAHAWKVHAGDGR